MKSMLKKLLPLLLFIQVVNVEAKSIVTAELSTSPILPVIEINGFVVPKERITLSAPISGEVLSVPVLGAEVTRGDTIIHIDDFEIKLLIEQKVSKIKGVTATLAYLRSEHIAMAKLQNLDYHSALKLDEIKARIDELEASLVSEKVDLNILQKKHNNLAIKAPVSGRITKRIATPGEFIDAYDAIAVMESTEANQALFRISSKFAGNIKTGSKITLKQGDLTLVGTISSLHTLETGNAPMYEVRVDAEQNPLTLGSNVIAELPLDIGEEYTMIPNDALVATTDGHHIFTVRSNKAHLVAVQIIRRIKDKVMIKPTEQQIDTVVIRGNGMLSDGDEVVITQAKQLNL